MLTLKQDINLYQLKQEFVPFLSFTRMVQVWSCLLIILSLYALEQKITLISNTKEMERVKSEQGIVISELTKLSSHVKGNKKNDHYQEDLTQLKENINQAKSVIAQLLEEEKNKNQRLSSYLEGFALQHVKGTFVSHFNLEKTEKKLSFEGYALQPHLVPQMVQSWEQAPAMSGKKFHKLEMQRLQPNAPWVEFHLQGG
jgi:hypothetical protein